MRIGNYYMVDLRDGGLYREVEVISVTDGCVNLIDAHRYMSEKLFRRFAYYAIEELERNLAYTFTNSIHIPPQVIKLMKEKYPEVLV